MASELVLAGVIALGSAAWLAQAGSSARPLVVWVGVSQSLAVYDVLLNAFGGERFTALWWASLSLRVATYGVLAVASVLSLLAHLRRVERYASAELDRREGQLQQSLGAVRQLLDDATEASTTLQEQLLPRKLSPPSTVEIAVRYAGAGPDKQIGGEWYDAITLPDGGLALVIGDVEGHDLAAAAVMGQVRAAVNSYALEGHPPSILLNRVNRFLLGSGIERYVALVYVQLYPGDRLMTIAVAGNPPPLVVPHDGTRPTSVPVDVGPPLGLHMDQWYERTMMLSQAADLALFTDGVYAKSPWEDDGEPFPHLLPTSSTNSPASLEQLADALVSTVTDDDAAVLVARILVGRQTAAERALPVRPISAPIARIWLTDLVDVWVAEGDLVDSPNLRDRVDTAVLLMTELVSNALRHGEDTIRVCLELTGSSLRVDVVDTSHRMPARQVLGETETSGRGLPLVEGLSDSWGIDVQDRGKSVWFCVDLAGTPPDEEELLAAFGLGDSEEDILAAFDVGDEPSTTS